MIECPWYTGIESLDKDPVYQRRKINKEEKYYDRIYNK